MRIRTAGAAVVALTMASLAFAETANRDVAKSMVSSAMVKPGDKVWVYGSVRDYAILEELAVETMKAGGQPIITVGSEELVRRSYDEVPTSYDSQAPTLDLALMNTFDVMLSVEVGENEGILAGVPPERIAARSKADVPVMQAMVERNIRYVGLGNGLYPTAALANRLGVQQGELAATFWRAVAVPPDVLRTKGEAIRSTLMAAKKVTLKSANGTNVTFRVDAAKGFVSDGAVTAEHVKQGKGAASTWLPAGELLVPVAIGSAEGTVVIDKMAFQGKTIENLKLTFSKGKLTSMTAKSGLEPFKALYDASGEGKDQFSYIDVGLNPEAKLPTNTGRLVWMAPGNVTIGMGDNTGWGGTNVSEFGMAAAVTAPTLTADGKTLIDKGTLK
jgi:leucyl aminopeptidase (aminopeptidase T)